MTDKPESNISSTKDEGSKEKVDSKYTTRINSKYIPHPRMLKLALEEKLGKKRFEIEMRQSVYVITSSRQLSASDLVAAVEQQEYPTQRSKKWYTL